MAPNAAPRRRGPQSRCAQGRASTPGDSHRDLDLLTSSWALETQPDSIPGVPTAVEFSGGFIG